MPAHKRKPVIVDGVEHFICRTCPEGSQLHPRDDFHKKSNTSAGIASLCKSCENKNKMKHYYENAETLRARTRKAAAARRARNKRRRAAADKLYEKNIRGESSYAEVPLAAVKPWAETLFAMHETLNDAAAFTGVNVRRLWDIRNDARPSVHFSTAEKIAMAVDELPALHFIAGELGKEGWSRAGHRFCQRCGTYWHPHQALGLCESCYKIDYDESPALPRELRWSMYFQDCQCCNKAKREGRKHYGRGLCTVCYGRAKRDGSLELWVGSHPARGIRRAS